MPTLPSATLPTTTTHAARDPLGGMLFFHRSIRAALQTFDDVALLAGQGDVDSLKCAALHEFFSGPMRWHDVDERESLLKRLARFEPSVLAAAVEEHERAQEIIDLVLEHLKDMAQGRSSPDAARLHRAARDLRRILDPHLEREEREVFPRARALLSPADLEEMAKEIAVRRLLRYAASGGRGRLEQRST